MKQNSKKRLKTKTYFAFVLAELLMAITIATIPLFAVGLLVVNGQKQWQKMYESANKKIKLDAMTVTATFSTIARKSNRQHYTIYNNAVDFSDAESFDGAPAGVVGGDAVELRYWDVPLSANILDTAKTCTVYAIFYRDGDKLKLDQGPWDELNDTRGEAETTRIIAENLADSDIPIFTHATVAGAGQGCIAVNLRLTDPQDGETLTVVTAARLRNFWPG